MASQILVLSSRQNDIEFWQKIAENEGLPFKNSVQAEEVTRILEEEPNSLILWDVECEHLRGIDQTFLKMGLSSRVLVVTDGPAREYPQLFAPPAFNHHLSRRYTGNAEFLCSQLVKKSKASQSASFGDYFKDITVRKSFTLNCTAQKGDVIDAFYQTMLQHQLPARIADLGSDAIDELLMNAVFDAPVDAQGEHYRRKLARDSDFVLEGRETVEAELLISPDLVGIRVMDQFGSLKPESAMRCLGKNFEGDGYVIPDADPGAGLGLLKLNQAALTLVFLVEPGVRTESIVLFNNTRHYRDLRASFCLFSITST